MFREHGDLSSRWVRVRMRKGRLNPPPWHRCSGKQLWHLPSPWPGVLSWLRVLSWPRVPRICQWGGRKPPELAQAPDSQKGSAQQVLLLPLPPSEKGLRPQVPSCHGLYPTGQCSAWWGDPQHLLCSVKCGQVSFVLPVPSRGLLGGTWLPRMEGWGVPGQRCWAVATRSSLWAPNLAEAR